MDITRSQAAESEAARYNAEESQHNLQQLKAEIAALVHDADAQSTTNISAHEILWPIVEKLRQLSAV